MVLWGIATGRRSEDRLAVSRRHRRLLSGAVAAAARRLAGGRPGGDPVAAYLRLLSDPDTDVRRRAADAWCLWESATPEWPPRPGLAERYTDPVFALGFARLVTHYVHHDLWIEDGSLLPGAGALAAIPGSPDPGQVRLPVATGVGLGAASRLARLGADRDRRRRPLARQRGRAKRADRGHGSLRDAEPRYVADSARSEPDSPTPPVGDPDRRRQPAC